MIVDFSQTKPTTVAPEELFTNCGEFDHAPSSEPHDEVELDVVEERVFEADFAQENAAGDEGRHQKLYEVQHWRQATGRYLDGTEYGYDPVTPPLI